MLPIATVDSLELMWDFVPSAGGTFVHPWRRLTGIFHARRRPAHQVIRELTAKESWLVYFAYLPDSTIGPHHLFSLARLRDLGRPVFVICATPSTGRVPPEFLDYSDALYWKHVSGYDFSAYTLAIESIAEHSTGASALFMNDSMYGPFCDLCPFIDSSPWALSGFTGSGSQENHIQSYSFILKSIDDIRVTQLRSVLYKHFSFSHVDPVISLQELRLARVAARAMPVGAFWYGDGTLIDDPCLRRPFELLAAGFPYLKRSLLGKMAKFQSVEQTREILTRFNHPT
ncbi:MAG: hypothetical protein JJU27_11485 [Gammaproteobacteria bacterium]|nr:hypothetical protein [Gammaproteobacteria bacterium]